MRFRTSYSSSDGNQQPGHPIVLLPGWATDCRVFDGVGRTATAIVPQGLITDDFSTDLADYLHGERSSTVRLCGWSLGGAAALRFARAYPEMVDDIVLFGVRPRYPAVGIDEAWERLRADREAYLADFYRRCFLPGQRDDFRRFKQTLMSDYLANFSEGDLLRGLDFLAESAFDAVDLSIRPTTVVHGALDIVAPVAEIADLAAQADFHVVADAAHAVFLAPPAKVWWPHE